MKRLINVFLILTIYNIEEKGLKDLKLIVMAYRKEHVEFLNKYLNEDDIIAVYAGHAHLLRYVDKPQKMLVAPSIERIMNSLEKLKDVKIDYITYNPEIYPTHNTPLEELENQTKTVKKIRKICDSIGAKLSYTPDKNLLQTEAPNIAPLVDMFGIQLQRYQRKKDFYLSSKNLINIIRKSNPYIPITIQLSMSPPVWKGEKLMRDKKGNKILRPISVDSVIEQTEFLKNSISGVAFLYKANSYQNMKELVIKLRKKFTN